MLQLLERLIGASRRDRRAPSRKPGLEVLERREVLSLASFAPAGGFNAEDFYIDRGNLYERNAIGQTTLLTPNAVSVSAFTGVNQAGAADVVLTSGALFTWSDTGGWKYINAGVRQAYAGSNGNTAVLFQGGDLFLYSANGNTWQALANLTVSASIGTDLNGGPMVAMVLANGYAFEWRAAGSYEFLAGGVVQVSAGANGVTAILGANGYVYNHYDTAYTATGAYSTVGAWLLLVNGGVASISAGTDVYGSAATDITTASGLAYEWGTHTGWKYLAVNVSEVDAGQGGMLYYVTPAQGGRDNDIFRYDDMGGSGADNVRTILKNDVA
jgi:hypothetical protein